VFTVPTGTEIGCTVCAHDSLCVGRRAMGACGCGGGGTSVVCAKGVCMCVHNLTTPPVPAPPNSPTRVARVRCGAWGPTSRALTATQTRASAHKVMLTCCASGASERRDIWRPHAKKKCDCAAAHARPACVLLLELLLLRLLAGRSAVFVDAPCHHVASPWASHILLVEGFRPVSSSARKLPRMQQHARAHGPVFGANKWIKVRPLERLVTFSYAS